MLLVRKMVYCSQRKGDWDMNENDVDVLNYGTCLNVITKIL